MTLRYNAHQATGTFTSVNSGQSVAGNAVFMGGSVFRKVADLSAVVVALAETNTLTLSALWQVSNNNSTWLDLAYAPNNPAVVVLATGTAGADTAVTKVIPAPSTVNGYKYARLSLVVGGTNGTVNDTYTIGYSYRQLTGSEAQ